MDDDQLNLVRVWYTLRKHWSIAAATTLAVALSVAFYTLGQTKIYEASATVQFDPNPPRPLGKGIETVVEMGAGSFWDNREYYETQYKIIQSMRVALAVVGELGLAHDAGFLINAPPGSQPSPRSVSEDIAADTLRTRLKVQPVKDSRLAAIKLEDADPARAQRILSTLVDTYVAENLDDALSSTASAVDWLRGQLDKLKGELEANEMALHEYKENKNILSVAFDDQSNMLREEMKQINDALTAVRTKREEVAARSAELAKVRADDPSNLPASELLKSTLLQDLRRSYEDAVRDRNALQGSGKGENHPETLAAKARVSATRNALLAEVRNVHGAVDSDLAILKRQEAGLSGLFEAAKKQALDLNLLEIEYNRLRRSKDNTEKLYSLVLERTKESDLTRMLRVNNIRIIDRPLLPRSPVRPHVPMNIGLGLVVGLLLGIGAALSRDQLDRTIKTPDDVERTLGVSVLGLLPEIDDNSSRRGTYYGYGRNGSVRDPYDGPRELIIHNRPTSGIAEASRAIRTNLLFMAPDHPYRVLLVTSAGPAEGKTTVASCIAIAMAQAGQRVVIVDCDLRRSRLHRIFNKDSSTGITTALLDENVDDVVFPTDIPNLWVVPAGPTPPNPAEIFHSERFKNLVGALKERFDRVIIDSPPVVAVTDAAILSTLVDGTVLVVRAFATTKELARYALRSLRDVGVNLAGTVLNKVNLSRSEYKYSHYYYKRDGYHSESPPSIKREIDTQAAPPPQ